MSYEQLKEKHKELVKQYRSETDQDKMRELMAEINTIAMQIKMFEETLRSYQCH